jgi:hypothetical protein
MIISSCALVLELCSDFPIVVERVFLPGKFVIFLKIEQHQLDDSDDDDYNQQQPCLWNICQRVWTYYVNNLYFIESNGICNKTKSTWKWWKMLF